MPSMEGTPIHLSFDGGTLLVTGADPERLGSLPGCRLDPRSGSYRAEARAYRAVAEHLRREPLPYRDEARAYHASPWALHSARVPFPHQTEALETWWRACGRGVVVLPTGTGKTFLAVLAIHRAARPAMVITPTIDLLNQWYDELLAAFQVPVGLLGGGYYDLQPL